MLNTPLDLFLWLRLHACCASADLGTCADYGTYLLHHLLQVVEAVRAHLVQDAGQQLLDLCMFDKTHMHALVSMSDCQLAAHSCFSLESLLELCLLLFCEGPLMT